jgi:uncharacterized protein
VPRLLLIGIVAGFFSAVFGVGGGILIVPLLLALTPLVAREATATSLAAIGLIALAGVLLYAYRGYVEPGPAAAIGLPAAVGALVGTTVQQRITNRTLTLLFAALLAAIGLRMVLS